LLHADRTPKVPIDRIAAATAGPGATRQNGLEQIQRHVEADDLR
jgi:hypothetical protein